MLFKVQVIVVRAVQHSLGHTDPHALEDRYEGWHDAVMYWFGINADDAANAVGQAERAAEHARDRNDEYIGGVIASLNVRRAHPAEFAGYDEYLLQPIAQPGIFYVTGTTSFATPRDLVASAVDALDALRQRIRMQGLPSVTFAHPMPPDPKPPVRTRVVCPSCHRWVDVDNLGIIYSLCEGFDPESDEAKHGRRAGRTLGEFIQRHTPCLPYSCSLGFTFIHADDPGFERMDPALEDDGGEP